MKPGTAQRADTEAACVARRIQGYLKKGIDMNNSTRLPAIALAAGMALSMVFAPPARAADCANPQGTGMARACAKAADGTNELRRFVERTQSIYHLSVYDFRVPDAYASASRETRGDEYAKVAAAAEE
jgi:hypothetical protein